MADIAQSSPSLQERLRSAFGSYVTGVTVVTAHTNSGEPVGFTANSFTSVSLDPALLLICVGKGLSSYHIFSTTKHFAVNILGSEQKLLADRFARFRGDRFDGIEWRSSELGSPLLAGSCAWFDCQVFNRINAGDHDVLIGKIHNFSDQGENGLGYFRHEYFSTDRRILA
ncbi:MAG: flavin reductase family protein [Hyphomicrobiales bacterium]|nr:flavin reductase family protein [Hyphomicrobiales bacterium]